MQAQLSIGSSMLSDLVGAVVCAPDTRGAGSCSPENPYLCTAGPSHLGCASSPWAVGAGADCQSQCMHPGFVYAANQTGYSLDSGQEQVLRYIVAASGILSLLGSAVIMWSALRFTELTKRFFAIRLISFLALTDACASVFNIMGGFVDVSSLRSARPPLLCQVQAAGLLYFNLSSIMRAPHTSAQFSRAILGAGRPHAQFRRRGSAQTEVYYVFLGREKLKQKTS